MNDKITFGDLHRLLSKFGFEKAKVNGPYVMFTNEALGLLQAFRKHRASERVDPMTLAAVEATLVEGGVLDQQDFEAVVRATAAERKANARQEKPQ